MESLNYNIAAVERDTGLSKDVLRVWERRYGFPQPTRDTKGERAYPSQQVDRLRQIKRLMDQGHRPGKLLTLTDSALAALPSRRSRPAVEPGDAVDAEQLARLLALIRQHDASGYTQAMQQTMARLGLSRFVLEVVAPLTWRIGQAWEDGQFEVYEEHLFTELTQRVLRQAIVALPVPGGAPRVLLTSVPDEQHGLGLLMVEALFSLEGAPCIPLGTQMPLPEIAAAALAHRVDVVALSYSVAFATRHIPKQVEQLRRMLPAHIALWVGGGGIGSDLTLPGVQFLSSLRDGLAALKQWTPMQPTPAQAADSP